VSGGPVSGGPVSGGGGLSFGASATASGTAVSGAASGSVLSPVKSSVHEPASFTYLQMRPSWQSIVWKHAPPFGVALFVAHDEARITAGTPSATAQAKSRLTMKWYVA
jgi:hypothetical protein